MKRHIIAILLAVSLGSAATGCSFSFGTGAETAPSATATSSTPAPTAKDAKSADDKPVLQSAAKPAAGHSRSVNEEVPIPDDWIYIYDDKKGYGFSLPAGSEGENLTIDGVDVFSATTPRPSEVDIFVLAYKDQTRSKVELLDDAVTFLEELGQDVTPGELTAQSDQFAVANATTIHPSRGKGRLRILVGTDITDNYVMIIGVEDERFAANEKIIDMIWGSFEIWSGGGVSG